MPTPRVLVTTSLDGAATEYHDAVREAGGEPFRVDASADPDTVLDGADALMLTGGGDVAPSRYGAERSPLARRVEPERDALEIALVRSARERRLPVLCICRGIQVANVAFGGSLIVDIPTTLGERPGAIRHVVRPAGGRSERGLIGGHVVQLEADSALARIVGTTSLTTGARHHQAVDRCSEDLRVVGRTADGIIEAAEARFDAPFWLAVQWHPESTRELDDGASRALFRAFVEAAAARHRNGR